MSTVIAVGKRSLSKIEKPETRIESSSLLKLIPSSILEYSAFHVAEILKKT